MLVLMEGARNPTLQKRKRSDFLCTLHQSLLDKCSLTLEGRLLAGATLVPNSLVEITLRGVVASLPCPKWTAIILKASIIYYGA